MKNTAIYVCMLLMLFTGSCEKRQPVEDYAIKHIKESLSPDEIETAFDFLGLKIERFNYYLPAKTPVTFFGQKYISGTPQGITGSSTLYPDAGLQKFTLFAYRENNSVKFAVQGGGGRVGCGTFNIEGYGATTSGWLNPKELKAGPEVPLYLFAANKNGIESFSPDDNIEELVRKYELVFVLYGDI